MTARDAGVGSAPGEALDLDKIEAAARAADQGNWRVGPRDVVRSEQRAPDGARITRWVAQPLVTTPEGENWRDANAAHITTADPPTVLALVARAREAGRLEERVRELEAEAEAQGHRVLYAVRERFRMCNHQLTSVLIASIAAEPKQVNNALGYLTRRGEIERVAYGQYRLLARTEEPADASGMGGGDAR